MITIPYYLGHEQVPETERLGFLLQSIHYSGNFSPSGPGPTFDFLCFLKEYGFRRDAVILDEALQKVQSRSHAAWYVVLLCSVLRLDNEAKGLELTVSEESLPRFLLSRSLRRFGANPKSFKKIFQILCELPCTVLLFSLLAWSLKYMSIVCTEYSGTKNTRYLGFGLFVFLGLLPSKNSMAVVRSMINDQLATIATITRRMRPGDTHVLKILIKSWASHTKRARDVRDRERAWRAVRNNALLGDAVVRWCNWTKNLCRRASERTAREAMGEARRCNRASTLLFIELLYAGILEHRL